MPMFYMQQQQYKYFIKCNSKFYRCRTKCTNKQHIEEANFLKRLKPWQKHDTKWLLNTLPVQR